MPVGGVLKDIISKVREHPILNPVFEVPKGTKLIDAGRIPEWVATKKVQFPYPPKYWVQIEKKIPSDQPNHFYIESLTQQDHLLLKEIWAGMPDFSSVSREEFVAYFEKFDASPSRPQWTPYALFYSSEDEYRERQREVCAAQMEALGEAIKNGEIRALDLNLAPTKDGLKFGTMLTIDNARAYLATIGFELKEVEQNIGHDPSVKSYRAEEWPIEKITSARARRLELRGMGRKDFHAQAAKEFGVSVTTLRNQLNKLKPQKQLATLNSVWSANPKNGRKK